jgi:hypothetical protein
MRDGEEHPRKPQTEWCRLSPLMKWKGWSEEEVDDLVANGELKIRRFKKKNRKGKIILGRRYYNVKAAEKL